MLHRHPGPVVRVPCVGRQPTPPVPMAVVRGPEKLKLPVGTPRAHRRVHNPLGDIEKMAIAAISNTEDRAEGETFVNLGE